MKNPKIDQVTFNFIWDLSYLPDREIGHRFFEKNVFNTSSFVPVFWCYHRVSGFKLIVIFLPNKDYLQPQYFIDIELEKRCNYQKIINYPIKNFRKSELTIEVLSFPKRLSQFADKGVWDTIFLEKANQLIASNFNFLDRLVQNKNESPINLKRTKEKKMKKIKNISPVRSVWTSSGGLFGLGKSRKN